MLSLLMLGFLIGMRHALEADHLAAVAAITSQNKSIKDSVKHGAVWGLGHTSTLFLFGSTILWLDSGIPETIAANLELAVGVMLILLGLDVVRRLIKDRIHYHAHKHDHEEPHFHAHSHAGEGSHEKSTHQHHHSPFPYKTLCIGFMHGMAGSAALIILTLGTIDSIGLGMLYILLFGIGSMIGMAAISMIIAIPLKASADSSLTWIHNGLQGSIGLFTVGLGISIVHQIL